MLNKLLTFVTACSLVMAGHMDKKVDATKYVNHPCEKTPFCARHRAFEKDIFENPNSNSDLFYSLDPSSIAINDEFGYLSAQLNFFSNDSGDFASVLNLRMTFYQNGIMRTLIEEPGSTRFRISAEGLPVEED